MSRPLVRAALPLVLATAVLALACGKKGPPLPPLVLLPNPPEGFAAVRQGDEVALSFTVPGANTDRSTPADLARIEVYAWTTPGPVGAEEVVRQGERIGTLAVNKAPDPDEPEPETPAPKGPGLDQNEAARVTDTIDPAVPGTYRSYVAVGVNSRGRRGALTPRVAVPLVDPPAAPGAPRVTYDEKAITVAWAPVTAAEGTAVATPELAHSIHVEVAGLDPHRWYFYRFDVASEASPVGRARTAPAANAFPDRLQFAFARQAKGLRDHAVFRLGWHAARLGVRTGLADEIIRRPRHESRQMRFDRRLRWRDAGQRRGIGLRHPEFAAARPDRVGAFRHC